MADTPRTIGPLEAIRRFFALEASGGLLLVAAAVVAVTLANSPLAHLYDAVLRTRVTVAIDTFVIDKPLLLWINDGLMALFFFLVGLELKREALDGELKDRAQILLPLACAGGGFVVPALLYVAFNWTDPRALDGWAIPAATDIAFSLGVLALLGSRVPIALKVFLASLAIFDDLAAIVVIAVFYADDLSTISLVLALALCAVLVALNRAGVTRKTPYGIVGILLWVCVLKSGVHATLAGVAVALAIPMARADGTSPLGEIEDALHPWAAFAILPIFAFANAGLSFAGIDIGEAFSALPLGIAVGLFLGKQLGVVATAWVLIRLRVAELPNGSSWTTFYGVAVLAGIGFTMSLFIGTLAFGHDDAALAALTRLGVIAGSAASALVGAAVLRFALPK